MRRGVISMAFDRGRIVLRLNRSLTELKVDLPGEEYAKGLHPPLGCASGRQRDLLGVVGSARGRSLRLYQLLDAVVSQPA